MRLSNNVGKIMAAAVTVLVAGVLCATAQEAKPNDESTEWKAAVLRLRG